MIVIVTAIVIVIVHLGESVTVTVTVTEEIARNGIETKIVIVTKTVIEIRYIELTPFINY